MYKTDHKNTAVPEKRTDSSVEILGITCFFKYFIIKVVFSKKKNAEGRICYQSA